MLLRSVTFFILILVLSLPAYAQYKELSQLQDALKERSKMNVPDDTSLANLFNDISVVYIQNSISDSALIFARKALALSGKLNYDKGKADAYANMAKLYYKAGDYNLSLGAVVTALRISNTINDAEGQANLYNILGLIYLSQDKPALASAEFIKASKINKQKGNHNRLSANYFNISLVYFHTGQLDSSIIYLDQSIAVAKEAKDLNMVAMAHNRLGDIYYKKRLLDKAIQHYFFVLNSQNYQNDWENSFAHSGLANCYYQKGNYLLAIKHGETGLALARKTGGKWDILRCLEVIHKAYAATKNYQYAYNYLTQDKLYSDSLFNESKEKEINALHLGQKEIENEVLGKKNQIAQQKNNINRMIILIVSLVAIFLVILVFLTNRNARRQHRLNRILRKKTANISRKSQVIEKQNAEISDLNLTKDQLLSVISHDLRAPFASMLATLDLFRAGAFQKEEMDFLFDNFFKQVSVTSEMVDNLLLWANSQRNGITTQISKVYLPGIVRQVLDIVNSMALEKKIGINHVANEEAEILADTDHIKIILQNIVSNALKFTGEHGTINIGYEISDDFVTISIQDNGIGMPPGKITKLFSQAGRDISTHGTKNEKGIGIGLMLVKSFVEANHACIHVESKENKGTTFMISFKRYKQETP